MKIKILPSAFGESANNQYVTTFLIDDVVAIDAGCIGLYGDPTDQRRITHVFVTHSHADHIGSLPVFVETVNAADGGSVVVYGHPETMHALSTDVFNDRIWPDYSRLPANDRPDLRFESLNAEQVVEVAGLRITPVPVNHKVTTFGYVVESPDCAVVFGGDSGPTDRIWDIARRQDKLKAAFVETSFPNDLRELAVEVGHLTPELLRDEIKKLPSGTAIVVTHLKPAYRAKIITEIESLRLPQVEVGVVNGDYDF
jgi:cAMP phosphodiesterase